MEYVLSVTSWYHGGRGKNTIFKMIKYGLWMVHSWKSVPVSSILTNVKTVVFPCQEHRDTYVVYQLDLRPETKWPEPSGAPLPWWPGIPLDHLGSKHEFTGLSCDIAWQGNWSCKVFTNELRQKETLQLVSGNYSVAEHLLPKNVITSIL